MRNILTIIVALIFAIPAFANYIVVLRDGTTYRAKEKWKVANGQAVITLESGTQIQLDPRMIDIERTDQTNKLGLGDARLIKVEQPTPAATPQQRSLGSVTTLRRDNGSTPAAAGTQATSTQATASPSTSVSKDTIAKFHRAYDNVGLFDANVESLREKELKIAVTTNNEDEVFKAISATAFLISNLTEVDRVQLLMSTLNGGSAGKFEMTLGDAKALSEKHINWQSYYVQKVIY